MCANHAAQGLRLFCLSLMLAHFLPGAASGADLPVQDGLSVPSAISETDARLAAGSRGPWRGEEQMRQAESDFPHGARVLRDPAAGTVVQLKGEDLARGLTPEDGPDLCLLHGAEACVALALLQRHAEFFALEDPARELQVVSVQRDSLGHAAVSMAQFYRGVPVDGGEMKIHFQASGTVGIISGRYIPTPAGLMTTPRSPASAALDSVRRYYASKDINPSLSEPELVIHRNPYAASPPAAPAPVLCWRIMAHSGILKTFEVLVDAQSGKLISLRDETITSGG